MAFFDLPLDKLRAYRPEVSRPDDFEEFWRRTIDDTREHDLNLRTVAVDNRQPLVDAQDVTFAGYGGQDIHAWLLAPAGAKGPMPCVVSAIGYTGGRGFPFVTPWVAAGFAHLVLDTRGQGWGTPTLWASTPDNDPNAGMNSHPGMMTRGISSPDTYYYRRAYMDALRGLEAAREFDIVDSTRIVAQGGSQGGGLAIAMAGLAPLANLSLAGALVDVPFLCHFERAITLTNDGPYKEISELARRHPGFLDTMLKTLPYFDGVNLARYAEVPALFSVGLMDTVCAPSTVFAAYNNWSDAHEETPDTDIKIYPHSGHEGGQNVHQWAALGWLLDKFGD